MPRSWWIWQTDEVHGDLETVGEAALGRYLGGAPDRGAVTTAANSVDRLLRINPQDQGESRSGAVRIVIVSPLAVVYDVREADRLVEILSIRHIPVPPKMGE